MWMVYGSGNKLAIGYISHDKIKELKLEKGPYTLLFSQSDHLNRSKTEEKLYQTLPMKSANQKIYVSDTAQYTAVSKFAGGYEMVILGTIGILCGIYFLVRNVLWISMMKIFKISDYSTRLEPQKDRSQKYTGNKCGYSC